MIKEFERVFLTEDLAHTPYVKGDIGIVAHIHENGKGFEVEFFSVDGTTLGVETVLARQVQSCAGVKSVLHLVSKAA